MPTDIEYNVRVLVRIEENTEFPSSIAYGELVFCPDAESGAGQLYIGRADLTPKPIISNP